MLDNRKNLDLKLFKVLIKLSHGYDRLDNIERQKIVDNIIKIAIQITGSNRSNVINNLNIIAELPNDYSLAGDGYFFKLSDEDQWEVLIKLLRYTATVINVMDDNISYN